MESYRWEALLVHSMLPREVSDDLSRLSMKDVMASFLSGPINIVCDQESKLS